MDSQDIKESLAFFIFLLFEAQIVLILTADNRSWTARLSLKFTIVSNRSWTDIA